MEELKPEAKKQNSRFNIFLCTNCQHYFNSKYDLKKHMQRKNICGEITQNSLSNEIKQEFNNLMDIFDNLEKTKENKEELFSIYKKIKSKFNAIERYGGLSNEELQKAKSYLQLILENLNSII